MSEKLSDSPLLSVDISVDYPQRSAVLDNVRFEVFPGEIFGLLGESGSGKSTLALSILGLLDHTGASARGSVNLLGNDLLLLKEKQLRSVRGKLVSLIPQSPSASLNPALRIETQVREAWRAHSREPWSAQRDRVHDLFTSVRLSPDDRILRKFPGTISVGQAQRVLITIALLHDPQLLIADEPTSALDVIAQCEVLDILASLARERNMGILYISHDVHTVSAVCHRVGILHGGRLVECGPVASVFQSPQHPYTKQFLAAVPRSIATNA